MDEERLGQCFQYGAHLSRLVDMEYGVVDMSREINRFIHPEGQPNFCGGCGYCEGTAKTHMYGCNEAYRWGGQYMYYCRAGLLFASASVTEPDGRLSGGMVLGPMVLGDPQDALGDFPYRHTGAEPDRLPSLSPKKAGDLESVLAGITRLITGGMNSLPALSISRQADILNAVYDEKERQRKEVGYPIQRESLLRDLVCNRDAEGARRLLNELLAGIYLYSNFDLNEIRARCMELIVLLSRATIDAGAEVSEIFRLCAVYAEEIKRFETLEEMSGWLTGVLHKLMDASLSFTFNKHSDAVYKVMEYVRANYDKKLTLDGLAKEAFLSKSYLSGIFKEQMGCSISAYINRVRVEKSKRLLSDTDIPLVNIANICGFEDQSYFTKVFKKRVGVSPKRFRTGMGCTGNPEQGAEGQETI